MPVVIQPARTNFNVFEETVPIFVPTSTEVLTAVDVWIEEIILTGTGASSATVTITDGQVTPVAVVKDVSLAAGDLYQKVLGSRYCPGGIKWIASAATIVGFVRFKR